MLTVDADDPIAISWPSIHNLANGKYSSRGLTYPSDVRISTVMHGKP